MGDQQKWEGITFYLKDKNSTVTVIFLLRNALRSQKSQSGREFRSNLQGYYCK